MNFTHLRTFKLEEILPFIKGTKADINGKSTMEIKAKGKTYRVKLNTTKLKLFKRQRKCAECGKEGNIFILERQEGHKKVTKYHNIHSNISLNLYCHNPEKGEVMILMTQDHIIPKSYGGMRTVDNLQPMCQQCNLSRKNTVTNDDIKMLSKTKEGRRLLKNTYKHSKKKLVVQH